MSIRLLRAPAAAGKTQHCITYIQHLRASDPLAPVWVVLPDAAQAGAFRRRLARAGGAINVQTMTFYTLYAELLALAGDPVPRLAQPVLHRLLRAVVDELHANGQLQYYASLRDKPGFLRALRTAIGDLKRARARSEEFAQAVNGRGPHLEELAAIYSGYQRWLYRSGWSDDEGQGWLAAVALDKHPHLCTEWRLLVVDGFDQFNPTQLEVLRRLAGQVQETLATLTGDADTRRAHRRFDRARKALESKLALQVQPLPDAGVHLAPELAQIEADLFQLNAAQARSCGEALTLLEAPNRAEEVRAALRWLKLRIVEDGLPSHETAILARNLEPYQPFLAETAAEFELPLRLSQGSWLAENPVIAALLDLLALPLRDWPRRLAVEAWRSPYFDLSEQGIMPGDADLLDAAARHGQVVAGLEQWHDTLHRLETAGPAFEAAEVVTDEGPEEGPGGITLPVGQQAADLRRKLDAFVARLTPPAGGTLRDYTAWLEALIGDDPALAHTNAARRSPGSLELVVLARYDANRAALPTAERDVAALQALKDVLRGLVFAESALSRAEPVSYARFWRELRGAAEATSYQLPATPEQSMIRAAPVLAARGLSLHAVALLGLSEGEFPQAHSDDPLLRGTDRVMLADAGIELEPRVLGDEVTIFYEAVTRASEKLLVTRPYLADDGQLWEPSPYWEELLRLFRIEPRRVRPEDVLPPAQAASRTEFLSAVAHGLSRGDAQTATLPYANLLRDDSGWRAVQVGAQVLAARLAAAASGPHEGDLTHLQARLDGWFGADHLWSSSRLESYGVCAHTFFAAHLLGLDPPQAKEIGYDVRQLGNMYHEILEKVFRRASETGEPPQELLPAIAQQVFDAAPETYGFRPTPLWNHQRAEHEQILQASIEKLLAESDGWELAYFELPFGLHGAPALELSDADGEPIRLRGYIDRVDTSSDGGLRVIDYKAGSTAISVRNLESGKRVQLALYALAARDALRLGQPVAGMYWHIGSARASSLKLEKYDGGVEAALNTAVAHTRAYVAGIRAGRFAPKPPDGGCPHWCPAVEYCWRYSPRR